MMHDDLKTMLFAEFAGFIHQFDDLRSCYDKAIRDRALIQRRLSLIKELLALEGITVMKEANLEALYEKKEAR